MKRPTLREALRTDDRPLDAETFERLVAEGQALRREYERQTRRMRVIEPEDWR